MNGLTRRQFMTVLALGALGGGCARRMTREEARIGLALGGGGARGLAHVVIFETLDELGIRPYRIAGTSIGAVMGSLYAAGHDGQAIRAMINRLVIEEKDSWKEILFEKQPLRWLDFFDVELGRGGLLDSAGFIDYLRGLLKRDRFEQLDIPLQVVAADLWTGEQVTFSSGPLLPAIKASMAIPGLFEPVEHHDRYLVDGGTVNPLPHDLLRKSCDLVIAVDVMGHRTTNGRAPSYTETIFQNLHNMEQQILQARLKEMPPDIYLKPDIRDIRVLEFHKAEDIYRQAQATRETLIRKLGELIAL